MTMAPQSGSSISRGGGGAGRGSLYDVVELILDRGLVIDIFVRISVVGIELIKIDVRIVVASVDTYLRFAEACNRLDLEAGRKAPAQLPEVVGTMMEGGASGKAKGAIGGAVDAVTESLTGRSGKQEEPEEEPEEEPPPRKRRPSRRPVRRERE
ncbi:gas vesicle structural protein GvpA [Streptomyces zaomyceticus]|uniref:Gas vesicle protein A n=1 Tax=Streptomyces zaomyceticus TaxID=68286 RepID=A0ABZ1LMZ2_9ACTN